MDIWSLVKIGFRQHAEKVAVVHDERRVTFRDLEKRVTKMVNVLYGLGLKKGDAVSILAENSLTAIEAQYALFKGGFVWAPLTFRNHPKENAHYLNNAGAKALIMQSQFAEGIESVRNEIETVERYIVDGEDNCGMQHYEDLMSRASDRNQTIDIDENDPLCLLHTSGTTGKAKACLHTHKSWAMMAFSSITTLGIQPTDVLLHIAAINHGSGSLICPHFMMGVPQILSSHMDVEFILRTIEKERVTTVWLAPTMIYLMLAHPGIRDYDLSSLRLIPYSSSPIAVQKLNEALDVFGNKFEQAYGLTECPVITLLSPKDHLDGAMGNKEGVRRLGSAGREAIMTDVRIMGEDGKDLPPDKVGEIAVRSPLIMKEYWKDPAATSKTLRNGWLLTGDVGRLDDDGYLFIEDRAKDMLITGGYNVYPREVENAIFKHPAVLETAVIGIPDDLWGESVKAFVVLKPGMQANEEDIISVCRENLSSYKKPKSVDFVSALPKNHAGKVLKTELRERYWKGRERQV
jgi:acyl-CoA synthetase (AMP-forming)/AMP-acid ligase II